MSERYEYYDENGDPIDPAELDGDYEIVEEIEQPAPAAVPAPPAPEPAGSGRLPRGLLIGGGAAALALVGAIAAVLVAWDGPSNTVGEVREQVVAESSEVRESAVAKKEEVTHPPVDACGDLSKAKWGGLGSGEPSMRLRVVESAPLPAGFTDRMGVADGKFWVAQTGKETWTVSVKSTGGAVADGLWWVVEADTTNDAIHMTEGPAERSGKDTAGACVPRVSTAGAYQVVGDVPTSAEGLRDDQVQSYAIQASGGDENVVVGVLGDHLATMELEYAPEPDDDNR